jgi:hypothetical protein
MQPFDPAVTSRAVFVGLSSATVPADEHAA